MIDKIIRDIKKEVLFSNVGLKMNEKEYKNYLYSIIESYFSKISEEQQINIYIENASCFTIANLESLDAYFEFDKSVDFFINKIKKIAVRGYVVDCLFKITYINSYNVSVN